jgi:exonuclease SbcD
MRLLHLADTHIGTETYGRIDPETGLHTRLLDFERCLETAVDLAFERRVDVVLFAGDAYRHASPTPTWQQAWAKAVRRLVDGGLPLVMVAGNHDLPVSYGRATAIDIFASLAPGRVTVLRRPELVTIDTAAGPLQIIGLPWPSRSLLLADEAWAEAGELRLSERLKEACRQRLDQLAQGLDPAAPAVLLAHVAGAGAVPSGSERNLLGSDDPVLSLGVLADPRFDYAALGHVHRYQDLNPGAKPPVVYPGSLDRIDFGEWREAKGVCLVEIGPGPTPAERQVTYEHLVLPARRFVALDFTVPAAAEPTEWLLGELAGHDFAEAVVRVRYRCRDEQEQALDHRAIRAGLKAAHLVAGVQREREAPERRVRVEITEHLDLMDALERYLGSQPDLAPMREELVAAAREFDEQLRRQEAGAEEEAA